MKKSLFKTIKLSVLFFAIFFFFNTSNVESYEVENEDINEMGQEKSSENYKVNDALGQTTSGEIAGTSYKIQSGTMYYDLIPLSFTLSNSSVDFGTLIPKTPSTGSTDITVITNSPDGYKVTAYENTPFKLKNISGSQNKVPYGSSDGDDLPFNSITESAEGTWNDYNTQFGFGFTLENLTESDATFTSGYREFAEYSFSETPQEIMSRSSQTLETGHSTKVTYQVNIDDIQPAGTYENTIIYVLTATY